jgi:hypothetical protein
MCTVVALFRVHPAYPLVLTANRDERYARPSAGPQRINTPPAALAGRDERFGGTWFGIGDNGVAVAVTDQGPNNPAPAPRSRGLLVLDALACPTVDAVDALLGELDAAQYNPFALLYSDGVEARLAYHDRGGVRPEPLGPGMHTLVSSRGADHARWRAARVEALLDPAHLATLSEAPLTRTLTAALRAHATDPHTDDGLCRHNGDHGTVSSFVLLLAAEAAASRLYCAAGPPCATPYVDQTALLAPQSRVVPTHTPSAAG